jgi:hypothetical protein
MSPWEETWELDAPPQAWPYNGARVTTPDGDVQFGEEHGPRGESWHEATEAQAARARLAAAAPEMARALLRFMYDREDGACLGCGVYSTMEHKDRCIIAVALRKAGVPMRT